MDTKSTPAVDEDGDETMFEADDQIDLINTTSPNNNQYNNAAPEELEEPLTAEEIAWEESARQMSSKIQKEFEEQAKQIADKVQRQQEGKESAMLDTSHQDQSFLMVDDLKQLLESQMKTNATASKAANNSGYSNSNNRGYGRGSYNQQNRYNRGDANMAAAAIADPKVALKLGEWFLGRARYIPVRLSYDERKHLRQCKALMRGHEYTQKVDGKKYKSAARRTHAKAKAITSVLTGMITCLSSEAGKNLAKEKDFTRYHKAIQTLFEIGRRYKIMNPDRMRGEYGKMLYLLQDCAQEDLTEHLGFNAVVPVKTVYDILDEGNALAVLQDPHVCTATAEILPENKSRDTIQREIKQKETAKKYLAKKYSHESNLSKDDIELCLNSICDNNNFLNSNRKPIDRMLISLQQLFHPSKVNGSDVTSSLAIGGGGVSTTGVGVVEGAGDGK